VKIIRHVNERWDGQGAPDRLAGEKIPLGSRVMAVLDAFDGLTAGARARRVLPTDVALKEIETCAGKQFDPSCVDLLKHFVHAGKIV
jgi:response regulator RpfG family c-di-GMP phosphodiesterase